jgi:uncharacterized protein
LPQVTKGTHPEGAGSSALDHVLGELATVPPDRGIVLAQTWRLHPEICSYISAAFYEGRLQSEASTRGQAILPGPALEGTGLRLRPMSHARDSSRSPEEAATVVETVAALVGRSWTNQEGGDATPHSRRHPHRGALQPSGRGDLPAPQEAARRPGARRLRGQVSGAGGSARALLDRALAVVMCSPDLFRIRCRTPEEMRLANAFCLFREAALEIEPSTPSRSRAARRPRNSMPF